MSDHVEDLLHDWFLGALSDRDTEVVDAHLESCAQCRVALDLHLALMADGAAHAEPPPVERLLAAATPIRRFERFIDSIAALADVTAQTAREWLSKIDEATTWEQTRMPALSLFHIDGGPAVDNAIVGFVQIAAGQPFPEHTHLGEERIFVVQGGLRDENGDVHGPGALVRRAGGTTHSIAAEPGVPLIYLNVVDEGLQVGETTYGPDSDEF